MNELLNTWDRIYRSGTEWGNKYPTDFLARYVNALPPGAKILDLGCGNGRNAIYLAELGFDVTAIDASSVATDRVVSDANNAKLRNIKVIRADITRFELTGQYDAILLYGVLNSLAEADWSGLVERVKAATKPDGLNIIAYFNRFSSNNSVDGTEVVSLAPVSFIHSLYPTWSLVDHDCRTDYHSHGLREPHIHVTERVGFRNSDELSLQSAKSLTVGVIGPTNVSRASLSIKIPNSELINAARRVGRRVASAGYRLACIPDGGVGLEAFKSYNEASPRQRAKIFSPVDDSELSTKESGEWLQRLEYDAEVVSNITWEEQASTLLRHVDIVIVVGLSSGTLIEILWTKWVKKPVYLSLDLCSKLPPEVRAELNVFEVPTFENLLEFALPSGSLSTKT